MTSERTIVPVNRTVYLFILLVAVLLLLPLPVLRSHALISMTATCGVGLFVLLLSVGLFYRQRFAWILAHLCLGAYVLTGLLFLLSSARSTVILEGVAAAAAMVLLNLAPVRRAFGIQGGNRIVLGIVISVLFLFMAFRGTPFERIWAAMLTMNFWFLVPAIAVYVFGIYVRAVRWQYIMNPVKHCPISSMFPIYIISYMANNILPLRMGDLYRAYMVGRKEQISKTAALTTVGVERIFDGLVMLLFLLFASFMFPFSPDIKQVIRYASYGFGGMLLICYFMVLNRTLAEKLFHRLVSRLPERVRGPLLKIFDAFFTGLGVLKGPRDLAMVGILSVATWLIEAVMYELVLLGFHVHAPFHAAISTLAVVNLGIIIPAGPGYFGPFEYFCSLVLGPRGYGAAGRYGLSEGISKAFALVLHVIGQWIPSTGLGLFYMWREHVSFQEVESDSPASPKSEALP